MRAAQITSLPEENDQQSYGDFIKRNEPGFEQIAEEEISFGKKYAARSEEAVIVQYLIDRKSVV